MPECGGEIAPSAWVSRGKWMNAAGEWMPERRRSFRPARCTSRKCDWEGPSDETAVREAKERAEGE